MRAAPSTKPADDKIAEKKEETVVENEVKKEDTTPTTKGKAKPPALKKENSSLFKSFAKTKEVKKEQSASDVSAAPSPAAQSPAQDGEQILWRSKLDTDILQPT